MMQQYLEKHPDVFINKKEQPPREMGIGCACKNNRCIRKYCECYRTNLLCSDKCSCRNCENGKNGFRRSTTSTSTAPPNSTMMFSTTNTTATVMAMPTLTTTNINTNLPKPQPDGTEPQSLAHNDSLIEI